MKLSFVPVLVLTVLFGTLTSSAMGQTRVAGHVGFVLPLVTQSDGTTTTLSDAFSIGFPTGITLKGPGRLAFDMELVPSIQKRRAMCPSPSILASSKLSAGASQWGCAQPSWSTPALTDSLP
jgi:hypothetical protein